MGNYDMCDISNTAGPRAKRTKIWISMVSIWPLNVQFRPGVIQCFPIFNNLVFHTRLVVERNGSNFEHLGEGVSI